MSMYCKTCDRIIEEDDRNQCGECMKNDAKAVEMVAAFKPLADAAAEHFASRASEPYQSVTELAARHSGLREYLSQLESQRDDATARLAALEGENARLTTERDDLRFTCPKCGGKDLDSDTADGDPDGRGSVGLNVCVACRFTWPVDERNPHAFLARSLARKLADATETGESLLAENARLREALERIARPRDCGCWPCRGQCESQEALLIEADAIRDIARLAPAPASAGPDFEKLLPADGEYWTNLQDGTGVWWWSNGCGGWVYDDGTTDDTEMNQACWSDGVNGDIRLTREQALAHLRGKAVSQ